MNNSHLIQATGKRKTAIAQVILKPNKTKTGQTTIRHAIDKLENKVTLENFFPNDILVQMVQKPLWITGTHKNYDVHIKVKGGGFAGQAGACSLGIARSIAKISEKYRVLLREAGLLTRDSRIKERRKYGLKKARKAPQFSKR